MTRQTRSHSRRPGLWMLAILVLVLALALGACGGRVRGGGNNNGAAAGNTTSQQYTNPGSNAGGSDLSSDDQQIQSALQSMDSAANDANTDYSGLDNNVVP